MKWNEEQQQAEQAKNFLDDLASNISNGNITRNPEQNSNYEQKKEPGENAAGQMHKNDETNGPLIEHRSLFRQQQSMTRGQSVVVSVSVEASPR